MTDKLHNGLPVKGYVPQTNEKLALVNANKEAEERILRTIDELQFKGLPVSTAAGTVNHANPDYRWLAVARTHIEQGFMALNRAIFQPSRVRLPEDDEIEPRLPI